MDVEEVKNYLKKKIEADDLLKQVRKRIKDYTWQKQDQREGFTETFKPLISQFEKPDDPKAQNIFTQNQKMLQNQLALTEGIRANQKAITDGFSQFERLADMQELPGIEAIENGEDGEDDKDDEARAPLPKEDKKEKKAQTVKMPIAKFDVGDLDKYLNNKESQDILKGFDYENLPSFYFDKDIGTISSLLERVNKDAEDQYKIIENTSRLKISEGYQIAEARANKPHQRTVNNIRIFNILSTYAKNLDDLRKFKQKSGSGLFTNPQDMLDRFVLLNGSLAAGNNGVLPEYIQIAHRLRDLGILSNKQLNSLLKKII